MELSEEETRDGSLGGVDWRDMFVLWRNGIRDQLGGYDRFFLGPTKKTFLAGDISPTSGPVISQSLWRELPNVHGTKSVITWKPLK
jgi:hypothetical protein